MTDNDRTAQLERACSYLRRIPAWYLATTDVADGHHPRVRPFSFAMVDDGEQHDSANDGRLAFFSVRNIVARFCDIDGSEERLEL